MIYLLIHVFIVVIWLLLSGSFSLTNTLFAIVMGYLLLIIGTPRNKKRSYVERIPAAFNLFFYFIIELVKANLVVAREMIDPRHTMDPGIVAVPLSLKSPFAITLFANLVTLTPGTLTMEISEDHKLIYIHAMYVGDPEAFRLSIKDGFERRVMEVFE